jgi:rhamnosyltransferase
MQNENAMSEHLNFSSAGEAGLKFALVMPTLNAAAFLGPWIESFNGQTVKPGKVLIIDSASGDGTADLARLANFEVVVIPRRDFNHGGTRQAAAQMLGDFQVVVFVTQDVVFADKHSLSSLLSSFTDADVGAAYGRQLPHLAAGPIGAHARLFNYPAQGRVVSREDIPGLGLKAAFLSNSFSAYRQTALNAVGGFPTKTIMNEDTFVAAKMLLSGMKVAYASNAQVRHSHDYTMLQDFRRYFDIGVFHAREAWLSERFGHAEGEGFRFLKSEISYLWKERPELIPKALGHTFAKYAGYRLGLIEKRLPAAIKTRFSMHKAYWKADAES